MAGLHDTLQMVADTIPERDTDGQRSWLSRARGGVGAALVLLAIGLVALLVSVLQNVQWPTLWTSLRDAATPDRQLRWLLALLPGSIIVNHMVYLLSSRRKQFREALAPGEQMDRLADLYFRRGPLLVRYLLPAALATVLCATASAALTSPTTYLTWLWAPNDATGWPASSSWGAEVLRGAAFGFIGAYVYMLLLLTDRARQRDITSGVAVWAASMLVLGPLMGGVAALLLASGAGPSSGGSFTRDAVFFVAGMLPQQFAAFVQSGVRKIFQPSAPTAIRSLPLTLLRGVGPEVEARLEEEGIHDVSALAYASPYALIRATTYAPKQVADWIDEALLIATVPAHWDALEKVGVTGAMDFRLVQGQAGVDRSARRGNQDDAEDARERR